MKSLAAQYRIKSVDISISKDSYQPVRQNHLIMGISGFLDAADVQADLSLC